MKHVSFAVTTAIALAAAPVAAQQHPMGPPGAKSACAGIVAMHMGMLGGMPPQSGMHGGQPAQPGQAPGMMSSEMAEHHEAFLSLLPPDALLSSRQELALSDDQVSKLEHLQNEQDEDRGKGMHEASQEWRKAMDALGGEHPDLDAYKHALQEVSEQRIDAQVATLKTALKARDLLTDEQRAKVPDVARRLMQQCAASMPGMHH